MYNLEFKTKRQWKDPEGYRYLAPWSNLMLLRVLVRIITGVLPNGEYRLKRQVDDASRSAVSTLEEGWKRPTTKEYLDFLGFSQGSLEEIRGDIHRMLEDGFIKSKPGSSLNDLGIGLKEFKEFIGRRSQKQARARIIENVKGEVKGNSSNQSFNKSFKYPLREPTTKDYLPLKDIKANDLTFEMFIELINKTDYLLRRLISSLQQKDPYFLPEKEDDKWVEEQVRRFKGKG